MQHKQCSVYQECGGCTYQDLQIDAYQDLKKTQFKADFHALNLSETVFERPIFIPNQTRRRTVISFFFDGTNYVWGYKQEKSHKIIAATDCIVVTPVILHAMNALSRLIRPLIKKDIQVKASITQAYNGIDIHLKGLKAPKPKLLTDFHARIFQEIPQIIRLSIDHEIVTQTEAPFIDIANFKIALPLDCFLQPSEKGQEALIQALQHNIGKINKKTKIIDLFCGLGTFTIPLLQNCAVDAFDNAGAAIDILASEANHLQYPERLNVYKRDLFRDPLSFIELKKYDIAVLDPPRAGAEAQVMQLAKSDVKKIIYVFCNTKTAARDLNILQNHHYKIHKITAIDQFIYSRHIEGISIIEK